MDYRKEIADIEMALTVARKSKVRPSLVLVRYLNVLQRHQGWKRKAALAQTKLDYYDAKCRSYAKKLGRR